MPTDTEAGDARRPRDFDGLFKSLLEAHPEDALRVLCGADLDGAEVVLEGPTEQQRHLTRSMDKVFIARRNEDEQDRAAKAGLPIRPHEVYHFEVQVKRASGFEERMVGYWSALAIRYNRKRHRIHQFAIWPLGGGYAGTFRRDGLTLNYQPLNLPDGLDPEQLLSCSMAPIALWSKDAPPDALDRVADAILAEEDPDQKLVLVELGKMSSETVAIQLVETLVRRGMSGILEKTEFGRDLARRSREEGREVGRDEALVEFMSALLKHNYGQIEDLDELAHKLVAKNHEQHREWVMDRVPLEQLRSV